MALEMEDYFQYKSPIRRELEGNLLIANDQIADWRKEIQTIEDRYAAESRAFVDSVKEQISELLRLANADAKRRRDRRQAMDEKKIRYLADKNRQITENPEDLNRREKSHNSVAKLLHDRALLILCQAQAPLYLFRARLDLPVATVRLLNRTGNYDSDYRHPLAHNHHITMEEAANEAHLITMEEAVSEAHKWNVLTQEEALMLLDAHRKYKRLQEEEARGAQVQQAPTVELTHAPQARGAQGQQLATGVADQLTECSSCLKKKLTKAQMQSCC